MHDPGDLGVSEPLVESEQDRLAELDGEAGQGLTHPAPALALEEVIQLLAGVGIADHRLAAVQAGQPAPPPVVARPVAAAVACDGEEEDPEPAATLIARPLPPGLEQHVLGDLLAGARVAEKLGAVAHEAVQVAAGQHLEGRTVLGGGERHERVVVPLLERGRWPQRDNRRWA